MKVGWMIGIVITLVVIGGGIFYVLQQKGIIGGTTETVDVMTEEVAQSLEALEETAPDINNATNPIQKLPELNPIEAVNPFKYKNPFE